MPHFDTRHAYRHPRQSRYSSKTCLSMTHNKSVGRTYYKFRLRHYLHNMSVAGEGRCWNYPLLGCKLIVYQTPVKSVMKANVHFKQITPKAVLWHYGNSHVLTSEWKRAITETHSIWHSGMWQWPFSSQDALSVLDRTKVGKSLITCFVVGLV